MKFIVYILIFLPIGIIAQNLVPNPSFEDTLWCPYNSAQIDAANHWFSPIGGGGSSELFNECNNYPHPPWSTGIVGVPKNIYGYQFARTGKAYAGFCFYFGTYEYRENIEIMLINSINPTRTNYAEFYVSLGDNANFGIKNIGIYFSKNKLTSCGYCTDIMNLIPHIEYSGSPIIDTMNWVKVSGYFRVQEDGVQYMTIGNFADSGQTVFQQINSSGNGAYYFIDDVLVMDSLQYAQGYGINELAISNQELVIYPNPANTQLNIELENLIQDFPKEIEIYNCMGSLVKSLQIKQNESSVDVSNLPQGLYIIAVKSENEVIAREKIVISR